MNKEKSKKSVLSENDPHLRAMLENSSDAIIVLDRHRCITNCNPAFVSLFGFLPEEIVGQSVRLIHPDEESFIEFGQLAYNGILRNGSWRGEWTLRGKEGQIIPVESSLSIIKNSEGRIEGYVSMLRNIADRRAAEEALKESEEHYRMVVEQANDGMAITKGNSFLFANKKMAEIFGYDRTEEILALPLTRLIHPDDRRMMVDRYARRQVGEAVPNRYEFKGLRRDGQAIFLEISVSFIQYQGAPATLIYYRDVSERKKAEEEIRRSEQRYRELLSSVSDMVYAQDLEGRFTSINTAGSIIFGHPPEEMIGRRAAEFMKPVFRKAFEDEYLGRLKTEGVFSGTSLYFHKDGSRRYLEYRSQRVTTSDGRSFISGIARDVTERILQEKRLKQLQEQLVQAQRLEALGTLAGGVAHDFNNLLMGIQGRTSLMLMDVDSSHYYHEHLKGIEEYVKSAASLTKQLLGFARGGKYEVLPTDMNDLVKKTAEMFFRTQKEIAFFQKFQEEAWAVEVDRGQIEQVLMNLYVNAWQAMPGGGSIYLETSNVFLSEEQVKPYDLIPGRFLKISVKDTGTGMDEKTRLRIFDPFFTTKEMGRGTGLGLASAYGIIKNHGGIIKVFSRQGEGTAFEIFLPASEKKAVKEPEDILKVTKGSETILLVDDESMILKVGRQLLEKISYNVLLAQGGSEALKIYEKEKTNIDLVILDMVMPKMSGRETFDGLKAINPEVRVLLSSGYSLNEQSQEMADRGCAGFIQKPFSITVLSQKLREILGQRDRT